jgi:DtxR family Mn-dependent transcriptional regulator
MKKKSTTQSEQDYLKRIYKLTQNNSPASTNDLARELDVKPASVTGMIQKLAAEEPALVKYQKHQGVSLTHAGKLAALEVIRHHRLLETWLVETLGYSWDEVHEEAERLEHVISEDLEQRIAAALGHPARDPHGELIPTEDLNMPADDSVPLSSLRPHQTATILRVNAHDPSLLRHLNSLGLIPGIQIEVTDYSSYDYNLTIKTQNKTTVLGSNVTTKIFVQVGKKNEVL